MVRSVRPLERAQDPTHYYIQLQIYNRESFTVSYLARRFSSAHMTQQAYSLTMYGSSFHSLIGMTFIPAPHGDPGGL